MKALIPSVSSVQKLMDLNAEDQVRVMKMCADGDAYLGDAVMSDVNAPTAPEPAQDGTAPTSTTAELAKKSKKGSVPPSLCPLTGIRTSTLFQLMPPPSSGLQIELAKSGRSACRQCSKFIQEDSIRMGYMALSEQTGFEVPEWNHLTCFFGPDCKLALPADLNMAKGFDKLPVGHKCEVRGEWQRAILRRVLATLKEKEAILPPEFPVNSGNSSVSDSGASDAKVATVEALAVLEDIFTSQETKIPSGSIFDILSLDSCEFSYTNGCGSMSDDQRRSVQGDEPRLASALMKLMENVVFNNTPLSVRDIADLGLRQDLLPLRSEASTALAKSPSDSLETLLDLAYSAQTLFPFVQVYTGTEAPLTQARGRRTKDVAEPVLLTEEEVKALPLMPIDAPGAAPATSGNKGRGKKSRGKDSEAEVDVTASTSNSNPTYEPAEANADGIFIRQYGDKRYAWSPLLTPESPHYIDVIPARKTKAALASAVAEIAVAECRELQGLWSGVSLPIIKWAIDSTKGVPAFADATIEIVDRDGKRVTAPILFNGVSNDNITTMIGDAVPRLDLHDIHVRICGVVTSVDTTISTTTSASSSSTTAVTPASSSTTASLSTALLHIPHMDIPLLRAYTAKNCSLGSVAPLWTWSRYVLQRNDLMYALWSNALKVDAALKEMLAQPTPIPIPSSASQSTSITADDADAVAETTGKATRGKKKGKSAPATASTTPTAATDAVEADTLPKDYPEPMLPAKVRAVLNAMLEAALIIGTKSAAVDAPIAVHGAATASAETLGGASPGGMSLQGAIAVIGADRRALKAFESQFTAERVTAPAMKKLLIANGLERLSHGVEAFANGINLLYRGRFPDCPVCGQRSLQEEYGQYKCSAYVDSFTPCHFTAETLKMEAPDIPEELRDTFPIFDNYKFVPHPLPLDALRAKALHEQRSWADQDAAAAARLREGLRRRRFLEENEANDDSGRHASNRVIVKGRVAVSDAAELAVNHHVVDPGAYTVVRNGREKVKYRRDIDPYSVTLVATDILNDRNSYAKLQLLKRDDAQVYVLQKEWGRVGTSSGGVTTHTFSTLATGIAAFEEEFLEKSGNEWGQRPYVAKRGFLYPVSSESFAEDEEDEEDCVACTLPDRLIRILERICNKDEVSRTLRALRLDVNRLPAGKLTVERVKEGYACLAAMDHLLRQAWNRSGETASEITSNTAESTNIIANVERARQTAQSSQDTVSDSIASDSAPAEAAEHPSQSPEEPEEQSEARKQELEELKKNTVPPLTPQERAQLIGWNNRYFTLIPHHLGTRQTYTFHDVLLNPHVVSCLARVMEESAFLERLINVAETVKALTNGNGDSNANVATPAVVASGAPSATMLNSAASAVTAVSADATADDEEECKNGGSVKRSKVTVDATATTIVNTDTMTDTTTTTSTIVTTTSSPTSSTVSVTTSSTTTTSSSVDTQLLHPLDRHYRALKATLEPIPHDSHEFSLIRDYLLRTHAPTHSDYALELIDVVKVSREGEAARYQQAVDRVYVDIESAIKAEKEGKRARDEDVQDRLNRKLLWHGTRTANVAGILKSGLKISPVGSIITGKLFGEGIYMGTFISATIVLTHAFAACSSCS